MQGRCRGGAGQAHACSPPMITSNTPIGTPIRLTYMHMHMHIHNIYKWAESAIDRVSRVELQMKVPRVWFDLLLAQHLADELTLPPHGHALVRTPQIPHRALSKVPAVIQR